MRNPYDIYGELMLKYGVEYTINKETNVNALLGSIINAGKKKYGTGEFLMGNHLYDFGDDGYAYQKSLTFETWSRVYDTKVEFALEFGEVIRLCRALDEAVECL